MTQAFLKTVGDGLLCKHITVHEISDRVPGKVPKNVLGLIKWNRLGFIIYCVCIFELI